MGKTKITKLNKFDIILKSGTITTYIDTEEKKKWKGKNWGNYSEKYTKKHNKENYIVRSPYLYSSKQRLYVGKSTRKGDR